MPDMEKMLSQTSKEAAAFSRQYHTFERGDDTYRLDVRLKALLDPLLAEGFSTGILISYLFPLQYIQNEPKRIHDRENRRAIDQMYGRYEHSQSAPKKVFLAMTDSSLDLPAHYIGLDRCGKIPLSV